MSLRPPYVIVRFRSHVEAVRLPEEMQATVLELKMEIQRRRGFPPQAQHIVWRQEMQDGDILPARRCELTLQLDDFDQREALLYAAEQKHHEAAKALLRRENEPERSRMLQAIGARGRTPLHLAVIGQQGMEFVVDVLMDYAANEEERNNLLAASDQDSWTALHHAACMGHRQVCQKLLDTAQHRTDMLQRRTRENLTPLGLAWLARRMNVVALLLHAENRTPTDDIRDLAGSMSSVTDNQGRRLVHHLVVEGLTASLREIAHYVPSPGDVSRMLLARDTSNACSGDDEGRSFTPLHIAACSGHDSMCQVLCEVAQQIQNLKKILRATTFDEHLTALHLAAKRGHAGCCRVLLDFVEDQSQQQDLLELGTRNGGMTALHLCVHHGHENVYDVLSEFAQSNILAVKTFDVGTNALHLAVMHGHEQICKKILDFAQPPEDRAELLAAKTFDAGKSPFHLVAELGHRNICQLLLQSTGIRELLDLLGDETDDGKTPQHVAISTGHINVAYDLSAVPLNTEGLSYDTLASVERAALMPSAPPSCSPVEDKSRLADFAMGQGQAELEWLYWAMSDRSSDISTKVANKVAAIEDTCYIFEVELHCVAHLANTCLALRKPMVALMLQFILRKIHKECELLLAEEGFDKLSNTRIFLARWVGTSVLLSRRMVGQGAEVREIQHLWYSEPTSMLGSLSCLASLGLQGLRSGTMHPGYIHSSCVAMKRIERDIERWYRDYDAAVVVHAINDTVPSGSESHLHMTAPTTSAAQTPSGARTESRDFESGILQAQDVVALALHGHQDPNIGILKFRGLVDSEVNDTQETWLPAHPQLAPVSADSKHASGRSECLSADCAAAGFPSTSGSSKRHESSEDLAGMNVALGGQPSLALEVAQLMQLDTGRPETASCFCNMEVTAHTMFAALRERLLVNHVPDLPTRAHLVGQMVSLFHAATPASKGKVPFTYVLDSYIDWSQDWSLLLQDLPPHELVYWRLVKPEDVEKGVDAVNVSTSPASGCLIAVVGSGGENMSMIVSGVEKSASFPYLHHLRGTTYWGEPCTAVFKLEVLEVYEVRVQILAFPRPRLRMTAFWMAVWEHSMAVHTLGLLGALCLSIDFLHSNNGFEKKTTFVADALLDTMKSFLVLPVPDFLCLWNKYHADRHLASRCLQGEAVQVNCSPDGHIVSNHEWKGHHTLLVIVRQKHKDVTESVVPMIGRWKGRQLVTLFTDRGPTDLHLRHNPSQDWVVHTTQVMIEEILGVYSLKLKGGIGGHGHGHESAGHEEMSQP